MRKKVFAVILILLLVVAVASMLTALTPYSGGMGRGRGGMGFTGIFPYTSVVLVIGALALVLYYTILPEMPYLRTKEVEVGGAMQEKNTQHASAQTPIDELRFLEDDERIVCEALRNAGGSMLQKEIAWKTGYSKVKTHRVVFRLAKRGVVKVEKYFNTNKVTLDAN